jgi:hypothetical protein
VQLPEDLEAAAGMLIQSGTEKQNVDVVEIGTRRQTCGS